MVYGTSNRRTAAGYVPQLVEACGAENLLHLLDADDIGENERQICTGRRRTRTARITYRLQHTAQHQKQVTAEYSSSWEPILELRSVTCHMGSHSVTCVRLPSHSDDIFRRHLKTFLFSGY